MADGIDLKALTRGEKAAWDAFVHRFAGLILAAVKPFAREDGEAQDLAQEVFAKLCADGFRLLKSYDPARAGLTTFLTIVARSAARDATRRKRLTLVGFDAVPESALAVQAETPPERPRLPTEILSPRQRLVLAMMYDRDMTVAEIAASLAVDPQTVRSTHHKAMLKLRAHFAGADRG